MPANKFYEVQYAKIDWQVCYQEVSPEGTSLVGYRDKDGNPMTLPDGVESKIVDKNPFPSAETTPAWAKPPVE